MYTKLKLAASLFAIIAAALTISGCHTLPNHPNQINTFDGASYDSLTLFRGALTSLRIEISSNYPKYAPQFNDAAAAYSTAFNAYSAYRTAAGSSNQAQVNAAIQSLTLSIIVLENAFQSDLHVSAASLQEVRAQAARIRSAARSSASLADILTELKIAATIAEAVPQAKPYAALAAIVVAATDSALNAQEAAAGQAIDLSTIEPIAPVQ
jgi:hypothetical protein